MTESMPGDGTLLICTGMLGQRVFIFMQTLFDGKMWKFWPCLMEKSNNFDPVWWKNLKMLILFDGKSKKFDLVLIKRGYFPEKNPVWWRCWYFCSLFCGTVRNIRPCLMEIWKKSDPVWWRNEKNRTLFDGKTKYYWPCLMEKIVKKDPVWAEHSV